MRVQEKKSILNLVILLLSTTVFLCAFNQKYSELFNWHAFSWVSYLVVLFFLTVISLRLFLHEGVPKFADFKYFLVLFTVIAIPSIILRLSYVNTLSVWLDEYIQVVNTASPFYEAANQQQPPFVYQLMSYMVETFGFTEFWLRAMPVLAGVLVIFAGGVLGLILNLRKSLLATLMILLAVTPVLVRYSFEARPNIFGVFVGLIWLSTLAMAAVKEKSNRYDFYRVLISTFLFCSTIGMQPLALSLYSVPLLLIHQKITKKTHWKNVIFSQFLALMLFSPVLIGIVVASVERNQFQTVGSWLDRALDFSQTIWFDNSINFFEIIPFFELMLISMILSVIGCWFQDKRSRANILNGLGLAALVILPFIYTYIFYVTINWNFFERYFLCYITLFFTAFTFLLDCFFKKNATLKGKVTILLVSFLVTATCSWHIKANLNVPSLFTSSKDVRKVYDQINTNRSSPALIANFLVDSETPWEQGGVVSPEFYLNKNSTVDFSYRTYIRRHYGIGDQAYYLVNEMIKNEYKVVFLLMGPFSLFQEQHFYNDHLSNLMIIHNFDGYDLLEIQSDGPRVSVKSLIKYFDRWKNSDQRWSNSYKIRELLYYLHAFAKETSAAQEHYDWLMTEDLGGGRLIMGKRRLLKHKHAQLLRGESLVE